MAYNEIPSNWIESGKALKKRILTYVRDNFIDHETRIATIEVNNSKIEVFNFEVMGFINNYTATELTQIGTFKASRDFNLTEFKVILMNNPSSPTTDTSGELQLDLKKSEDNGVTWNSILDTNGYATIAFGTNTTGSEGSGSIATGAEEILSGELLRVDVISKKDTQGSFLIECYGETN